MESFSEHVLQHFAKLEDPWNAIENIEWAARGAVDQFDTGTMPFYEANMFFSRVDFT
jgi:hypothetical protein